MVMVMVMAMEEKRQKDPMLLRFCFFG